ncbi:Glutamate--tRNA ligase [Sedimentisphaera cyanobacteriorum]|uniref:Glutamate--tRNA ligase n=1 Tax=Sedimentisphaera cyanobacteriorum TaxID=1940790 RepID=A0A1Q2HRT9_9BACT|nr:glutamate--tRNA ligase [Sedimentisphaera cyanobacteriorum]AQQ09943.1 Glutamate--tRNA ligase [Sedimentisphaera cyanobacteriorum]
MTVTRFAPSPTGYLHIGGARTALFNWLYARKTGGKFILRIEDTDQKRNTSTAMKQVLEDLRWLGIDWDEGPEAGGENGPYLQSERMDIYQKHLARLLETGKAYYCFETSEELAEMREKAEKDSGGFIYKTPEKLPTEEDAEKARQQGRPVTVRFAVPQDKKIVFEDRVRGTVSVNPSEISDFIIRKSDGFPTYHFAVVVDDALMGVSHIIRGQEHLMNTPGHILLQEALGFDRPEYAHISLTVSDTGGKLSKRERPNALRKAVKASEKSKAEIAAAGGISEEELERFLKKKAVPDEDAVNQIADFLGVKLPEINVRDFVKSGYTPEAVLNFVALLGWNPGGDKEIMSKEEIKDAFTLNKLGRANSFFDRDKLVSFNTEHINRTDSKTLLRHFKTFLEKNSSPLLEKEDWLLEKAVDLSRGAKTFRDVLDKCRLFFIDKNEIQYDPKAVKKVIAKNDWQGLGVLRDMRGLLEALEPFTADKIECALRDYGEKNELGLGNIAQPLRAALSGGTVSPAIFDSIEVLGKSAVLERIDKAIAELEDYQL